MHPRRRLPSAILLIAAWLLASAAPVLAADPPPDVVLDGSVTVRFVVDGTPIAGAETTLIATRPELPEPFQSLTGVTDATGVVVFSGVARPDTDAPPVALDIAAERIEPNACDGEDRLAGSVQVEAAPVVETELTGSVTSSCPDVVIHGFVVDKGSTPIPLATAEATVTYPGEPAEDVDVELLDEPGEYRITIQGWTDAGASLVTVDLLGEEQRTPDPDSACDLRIVHAASASLELATPDAMEVVTVATPTVVGRICPDGAGGPTVTTPPTDGIASPDARPASEGAAATNLAALAIAALTAVLTVRRVSRRGS